MFVFTKYISSFPGISSSNETSSAELTVKQNGLFLPDVSWDEKTSGKLTLVLAKMIIYSWYFNQIYINIKA